jgi:Tfp pilus assembly protein PilX
MDIRGLAGEERGSILIIAVIAMLILGVLGVSFALLADIESKVGYNYKLQGQAEALAEAGLQAGADQLRSAASEPCGFTRWVQASAVTGCGAPISPNVVTAQTPAAFAASSATYWYSAVVENNCTPLVANIANILDAQCGTRDGDGTAVITAWASAGSGKARVRALLYIDDPWRHVCSDATGDNGGYCNDPSNANGSPVITPADRNDPNGPKSFDTLPMPMLGCSEIDPTLHGNVTGCTGTRKVITGDRSFNKQCDGGGQTYQGYFDCALTTPCPSTGPSECGSGKMACVKGGDTRATTDPTHYTAVGAGCGANTGMVFVGDTTIHSWGASGNGRNAYVLRNGSAGKVTIQSDTFHGVLVVEGEGSAGCTGPSIDMELKNNGYMWTEPTNTTDSQPVYGYPLALLVYDPQQAAPTNSPYAPQNTCADMGSANTEVHGMIYSGGHVQFNPILVDGSAVAFEIQTQGGANSGYSYNYTYGNNAPPPGFTASSGNVLIIMKKSFLACSQYATGSGQACQ